MSAFSIFYSTLTFFSSALVSFLLPWFVRFRSIPGLFAIGWLFVVNFLYGLNAAVFTGDGGRVGSGGGASRIGDEDMPVLLRFPAYCDIVTKLLVGMQMAVPAAMLCYTFSIHDWVVRPRERDTTTKRLEYRSHFHVALCLLAPLVYLSLHIAAQGHRFDIVDNVGCIPSLSSTALGWVLIWQLLLVPFAAMLVYGYFAFRYSWSHYRKYYAEYQTTWELVDSDLLFTNAPFGIIRIVRLSAMIVAVMLCTLGAPYYALAVLSQADDIAIARRPDFYRVEIFSSLNDASPSVTGMRLFLWSGPLYSVLLFAASVDKSVLQSYPFMIRKYILRQRVGANPDPSPGIELSTLTPIPVRRRTHRRVIGKSCQYDQPLSALGFGIPLPPRPDPGFLETASLPPVPSTPLAPVQTPRMPEIAFVKVKNVDGNERGTRTARSGESLGAMHPHVQTNGGFPLSAIRKTSPIRDHGGRSAIPTPPGQEDATRPGAGTTKPIHLFNRPP